MRNQPRSSRASRSQIVPSILGLTLWMLMESRFKEESTPNLINPQIGQSVLYVEPPGTAAGLIGWVFRRKLSQHATP